MGMGRRVERGGAAFGGILRGPHVPGGLMHLSCIRYMSP